MMQQWTKLQECLAKDDNPRYTERGLADMYISRNIRKLHNSAIQFLMILLIMASGIILCGCSTEEAQAPQEEPAVEEESAGSNTAAGEFDLQNGTVMLNSGYSMPIIGLGTWTLSNEEAETSVYAALKCGMRLIDTARYYQCEEGVGRGLQRAIDDGIVSREDVHHQQDHAE